MKVILAKLLFIALVAALVCGWLWWISPVHSCDYGAVLQGTNVECAK